MEVKSWAGYTTQERRMSVVLVEPVCMERMMDVTKEPPQAAQQSQPLDPGIQHDVGISCLAWSKVWPMGSTTLPLVMQWVWPVDQSKQAASPLQGQARPAMDPPETESTLR